MMTTLTLSQAAPLLKAEYQDGRLIPFLGAGFSKPLNLPDGSQLIATLAKALGFEPELFDLHGRFEQLAEYFALSAPNRFQQLVYEMTRRFDSSEAGALRRQSRAHQALAALDWRTLYTTNYDKHIEGALQDAGKPVSVLASFADFQAPHEPEACEVIKFHGTLAQPDTIVLTESSYFQRMALEAPPDQRLRADLLGNSFLFIGYSFSDINIRYVWYRMNQLRVQSQPRGRHAHARRCFFATHGAGLVQPDILEQWNIDVIQLDPTDKSASVAELLESIG
ncbi:MAG: SIR2 family protein [Archangium sp.]